MPIEADLGGDIASLCAGALGWQCNSSGHASTWSLLRSPRENQPMENAVTDTEQSQAYMTLAGSERRGGLSGHSSWPVVGRLQQHTSANLRLWQCCKTWSILAFVRHWPNPQNLIAKQIGISAAAASCCMQHEQQPLSLLLEFT